MYSTEYNDHVNIVDFIDLIDFTLSKDFIDKWKYKYSERFLKVFQLKIVESLSKKRPIKRSVLTNYFHKKLKYSMDQISNFYDSIDLDLYYPQIN